MHTLSWGLQCILRPSVGQPVRHLCCTSFTLYPHITDLSLLTANPSPGHDAAQPPELVRSGGGERTLAAQLHAVAKHLRKNPIGGATFAQALGSTAASKRAASCAGERQARRLALYIYWNVKGSQDRCAALLIPDAYRAPWERELDREAAMRLRIQLLRYCAAWIPHVLNLGGHPLTHTSDVCPCSAEHYIHRYVAAISPAAFDSAKRSGTRRMPSVHVRGHMFCASTSDLSYHLAESGLLAQEPHRAGGPGGIPAGGPGSRGVCHAEPGRR